MPSPVLFLEPLSGQGQNLNDAALLSAVQGLISILIAIRKINRSVSVNSSVRLADVMVSYNRTLGTVLQGREFADEWRLIKSVAANSPLSSGLERWIETVDLWQAYTKQGQDSAALLWAHICQSATVSFPVGLPWTDEWIDADCLSLDSYGNVISTSPRVRNFSKLTHLNAHERWLSQLSSGSTYAELWKARDQRFPGLRFLNCTNRQLADLWSSGAPYIQAVETLEALNQDSLHWKGNGELTFSVKVAAGEHDQRKDLALFKDEKSGTVRDFGRHAYFTGGFAGRIHFIVDAEEKIFVIGYVGQKL
jgi:hypothetical protein